VLFKHESLRFHSMPPWITKESHRPRVSDRTMSYRSSERITVRVVCFKKRWRRHNSEMEPLAGRISPFRVTKRSNDFLRKTTRRSNVHVQTIGLNGETKKCRHRASGDVCLLTFPFIGLVRKRVIHGDLAKRSSLQCEYGKLSLFQADVNPKPAGSVWRHQ